MRKTFEIPLDIPDVTIQTVETDRHGDFVHIPSILVVKF
jgi:hypothetical protein